MHQRRLRSLIISEGMSHQRGVSRRRRSRCSARDQCRSVPKEIPIEGTRDWPILYAWDSRNRVCGFFSCRFLSIVLVIRITYTCSPSTHTVTFNQLLQLDICIYIDFVSSNDLPLPFCAYYFIRVALTVLRGL